MQGVYKNGKWNGEILWEGKEIKESGIRDKEDEGIVIINKEMMMVKKMQVEENILIG